MNKFKNVLKIIVVVLALFFFSSLFVSSCSPKINDSNIQPTFLYFNNKKSAYQVSQDGDEYYYPVSSFGGSSSWAPLGTPMFYLENSNNLFITFSFSGGVYSLVVYDNSSGSNDLVCYLGDYTFNNYTFTLRQYGQGSDNPHWTRISTNYLVANLQPPFSSTMTSNDMIKYFFTHENTFLDNPIVQTLVVGDKVVTDYERGYNSGINQVLGNLDEYGLYNQNQYDSYGNLMYDKGLNENPPDLASNGFKVLVNTVLNSPFNILNGILNFELFGVNLFSLFSFIFTAVLVAFLIKLILRAKG